MQNQRNLRALWITFMLALCASLTPTFAQSPSKGRYEILGNGSKVATVVASFDGEVVSTAIYRQGQPTHLYRAYPQVAAIKVQVGSQRLFSYYIESGRIEANGFSFSIREINMSERRKRADVAAIRQRLIDDMRVLRAVRGYDKNAHVRLAELALVNFTGDSSIYENEPPTSLYVTAIAQAKLLRTSAKPQTTTGNQDSLEGCTATCVAQKDACIKDGVDKGKCYDNQTSCTNNCYQTYGNKKPATEESAS